MITDDTKDTNITHVTKLTRLNLRKVPSDLKRWLKFVAASRDQSMEDLAVEILREGLNGLKSLPAMPEMGDEAQGLGKKNRSVSQAPRGQGTGFFDEIPAIMASEVRSSFRPKERVPDFVSDGTPPIPDGWIPLEATMDRWRGRIIDRDKMWAEEWALAAGAQEILNKQGSPETARADHASGVATQPEEVARSVNEKPKAAALAKKIPGVQPASKLPQPPESKSCPECGSLHGMHMKGCSKRRR